MNRAPPPVHSPPSRCRFLVRRLPLPVAAVCLLACGEDSEPPAACGRIPEQTLSRGEHMRLMPCFEDPDGEELTLRASSSDAGVATVAVPDSAISVEGISAGSATITVVATDPHDLTAQLQFDVSVLNNRAPEVCGTIPKQDLEVGSNTLLQPCFEDPDGERITVSASSSNANVASVIVLGQAVRIKAVATGSATITVVATDPHGAKASLDIEVTVSESSP